MEMIISFTSVFAIGATILVSALILGAGAAILGMVARRKAREALRASEMQALKIADLQATLAATGAQLQALLAERECASAVPTRPSLREAVALSRHGATTEELVATCRIGQGEARLIQMLYGESRPVTVSH
jgi:hypothetical protein